VEISPGQGCPGGEGGAGGQGGTGGEEVQCKAVTIGDFDPASSGPVYEAPINESLGGAGGRDAFVLFIRPNSETPEVSGSIDLSQNGNNALATCTACVVVVQDYGITGGRVFMASSGRLDLGTAVFTQENSSHVRISNGSLREVRLVEVTVEADTSTPVPDGACLEIASAAIAQSPAPPGWTCAADQYGGGAGNGCDCGCGVVDPDCSLGSEAVEGCAAGETCTSRGACLPGAWTCEPDFYNAHDGCDCNCGLVDPDCSEPDASVFGCSSGEVCGPDGTCQPA
jgi:hypothetical protein